MKRLLAKLLIPKKRKEKLSDFAGLIQEVKKVSSVYECSLAMTAIIKFQKDLGENDTLKPLLGKLAEFVIDTREHTRKGYHKPAHNDWKTTTTYPNMNNYLVGFDIK